MGSCLEQMGCPAPLTPPPPDDLRPRVFPAAPHGTRDLRHRCPPRVRPGPKGGLRRPRHRPRRPRPAYGSTAPGPDAPYSSGRALAMAEVVRQATLHGRRVFELGPGVGPGVGPGPGPAPRPMVGAGLRPSTASPATMSPRSTTAGPSQPPPGPTQGPGPRPWSWQWCWAPTHWPLAPGPRRFGP